MNTVLLLVVVVVLLLSLELSLGFFTSTSSRVNVSIYKLNLFYLCKYYSIKSTETISIFFTFIIITTIKIILKQYKY